MKIGININLLYKASLFTCREEDQDTKLAIRSLIEEYTNVHITRTHGKELPPLGIWTALHGKHYWSFGSTESDKIALTDSYRHSTHPYMSWSSRSASLEYPYICQTDYRKSKI